MHTKLVTDINSFLEIKHDWNQLLLSSSSSSLPLSHEWLMSWWQTFGDNKTLHIICVYEDHKLLAVAPFMKEKIRYRGIPIVCLRLMTNDHTPFSDVVIHNEAGDEQKKQIVNLIINSNTTDILILSKIQQDVFSYQQILSKKRIAGHCYGVKTREITPVIRTDGSWDDFLKSTSRNFRKNLNNKFNRFKKHTDFTIDCLKVVSTSDPVLDEMMQISKNSWKTSVHNDLCSRPSNKAFLYNLIDKFGRAGSVHLWLMRKAGEPVAFEFHLNYQGIAYPLRADFDEHYRKFSPGSILEYTVLKELFETKKTYKYHSCADNYWYLKRWPCELRTHFDIEIFSKTMKSRFLYLLEYGLIPVARVIRDTIRKKNQEQSS
ncbi:MAG: GNAT family N-acetyltransferase [Candidatus Electrothrix sp. GW3-4]|uniref:GNAT family N-acetyltransferase n=1 Tax=Candidatus Electrothrix sp. GW3-4 TaxID=3126740 RepID=UPI0030D1DFBC